MHTYAQLSLFEKKMKINFLNFFEKHVFFWQNKQLKKKSKKKLPIYRNAEIIGNMHLFPLHKEPSPMPVGGKLWEQ